MKIETQFKTFPDINHKYNRIVKYKKKHFKRQNFYLGLFNSIQ